MIDLNHGIDSFIEQTRELLRHCYMISAPSPVQRKQIIELIK